MAKIKRIKVQEWGLVTSLTGTKCMNWDTTDLRTPSVSDGSTIVPDLPGRCLRRALDQKVRNLRKMISVDEDIATELDKVVCRLMKLALHSSMGRETPPPSRWMQCKLLDLLTLTEKAISRRKMCFIKSIYLKPEKQGEVVLEEDTRVKELVDKYRYLIQPDIVTNIDDNNDHITDVDVDIEDEFLSTTSNEFSKENDYTVGMSPSLVIAQPVFSTEAFETPETTPDPNPLERTKAWLAEDLEVEQYPKHEINYEDINSDDTDNSDSNVRHKHKKSIRKQKASNKSIRESVIAPCKTTSSKTSCKFKIKREFIKHSKTQITKKVAKKKSNCTKVVENPAHEYSSVVFDNYALTKTLNVAAAKPIPGSLIALCNPNLKTGKCTGPLTLTDHADRNNVVSVPSCISATEESLHINIIMQDCEETIALRRTIGTESTVEPEIETKRNVEILSNDFDKNLCTKHEVSTENVQSQTIFLNDINEPSTSKGIRHNISTDVQCGPDSLAACPLLSPATSVVKMPQVFSTGIIINDVGVDRKVKGTDFGTSTQETDDLKTMTPRWRPVGITIKDSEANLCCKTECSTMTIPESVPPTFSTNHSSAVHSAVSFNGTKLLKPISSTLKIEDSGSEFCTPSVASTSRTCDYFTTESKPTSNILMKSIESKKVESYRSMESPSKMLTLTCGAVHVHSYRDKQVSEDVVYQGEWQRHKPKANNARKKPLNYSTLKRGNEAVTRKTKENLKEKKVNSKEKLCRKKQEKKPKEAEPNNIKLTQMRNVKLRKVSQQDKSLEDKKPRVSKSSVSSTKPKSIPRPVKITKVPSKHAISANTSKNAKSTFTIKKSTILATVPNKKDNEKPQMLKKSYIPLYLKKTLHNDTLNKSLDSASDAMRVSMDKLASEIVPLERSSTEDIRKDLLTFSDDLRVNISYVVCRNDIEDKMILPDEQTSDNNKDKVTPKQKDMVKRAYSPSHSINSSTCSSPNSVATVKAASTRNKTTTKRHSAQSYKSNMTNSESDNASPPKKKVVKRSKAAKKIDIKDIGNKENIPESTKNFATKDKEKTIKSPFRPKSASTYIAQFETECSSSLVARQKAQISNKSIVKIPPRRDSDEKRRANTPSVSNKRSLKSDTSSVCDDFTQRESESLKILDSANMVLVLEPQANYVDLSRTRNISRKSSAEFAIKSNHNLMDELVLETSLHSNAGDIIDAMRQILEETLDRIIVSHGNKHHRHLSSHTIILSNDDNQKAIVDGVISSDVAEIKTSIDLVETSQSDIKNTLNRTFDTTLGEESTLNFNDTGLSIADLDLLSFKSVTSDSKYSEYYLADNEFNTSQEIDQGQTQNTTSVQDIFERKEPHLNQTTPGALAVQAFSGFSLDAEPVAGDQPDPLALMDSDTSSLAVEISRLATSEELFISGRSSESYASCVLDEDAVVPNWLFQLISQQHAVEENREPNALIGPVAAPHDEPLYDANGNVMEPLLGFGAGAGDGRGMHSDHSQDSSGRGTSLSSSETSSELQSEVSTVLIDPSAQFELLRDPMTSSAVTPMVDYHHSTSTRTYTDDDSGLASSRTRTINTASDIDADISSIDTDAPDLSDN